MKMTRVETSIRVERSIDEVFAYVADPRNFPTWNSAVTHVRTRAGSTYTMERQLPIGSVENELGVAERLGPLARFGLRRGVDDNLAALKAILDA
jgi:carbon monoxide dehydrogenase subunit G